MPQPVIQRIAREYISEGGKSPFKNWISSLKDKRGQTKITRAIKQMEQGNFGDNKPISGSDVLRERRIDTGPGYRIYYIIEDEQVIILFAGSDKSEQKRSINKAKEYLEDYQSRIQLNETSSIGI